jgi:protein involved in polysaccharide export with SLBB domain
MKRLLAIAWMAVITPCFAQVDYLLKPAETILIHAPKNSKMDGRTFRIQADGFVRLPAIGRMRAGGLTLQVFQKNLTNRLGQGSVAVNVVAFRSPKTSTPSQ